MGRMRMTPGTAIAVLALFVALGGTGYAVVFSGIPDSGGVFHACVKKSGAVRLVNAGAKCRRPTKKKVGEKAVAWSQTGPAGAPGATGPQGPKGDTGASGVTVTTRMRGPATTATPGSTAVMLTPSTFALGPTDDALVTANMVVQAPSGSDCSVNVGAVLPGTVTIQVLLDVAANGDENTGTATVPADGRSHRIQLAWIPAPNTTTGGAVLGLIGDGTSAEHTFTVKISENCGTGGGGAKADAHFIVTPKIDILRAS